MEKYCYLLYSLDPHMLIKFCYFPLRFNVCHYCFVSIMYFYRSFKKCFQSWRWCGDVLLSSVNYITHCVSSPHCSFFEDGCTQESSALHRCCYCCMCVCTQLLRRYLHLFLCACACLPYTTKLIHAKKLWCISNTYYVSTTITAIKGLAHSFSSIYNKLLVCK